MTALLSFNPPVIAHRGASAYAPENTLAAFALAADLGIKWVEFDVMQAACGEPIIFHDEQLDRTSNGTGDVDQYNYAYLQSLDAGSWFHPRFAGEKIPSLQQVMQLLKQLGLSANIELKPLAGQDASLVERVLQDMAQHAFTHETILYSSFSINTLRLLRKHAPAALLGLLLHEWLPDWQKIADELDCVSIHVNEEIMTEESAQKIKAMGKLLLCYTVNDPSRANTLFNWGVDAVFSDTPDKIIER